MKHIHFEPSEDGFYGAYWPCQKSADCAVIAMLGDDAEDHMARCGVWWLQKLGVNVLTMSPAKKNYSHHNYPLERVERAVSWLLAHGNRKVGIVGASTTGTLALTAASYFPEITLTIAMTPSDFVWESFMQGKKDGCVEWPIDGESLFTYKGEPLAYMPFCYRHPQYGRLMKQEAKKSGDLLNSRKIFDDSEAAHPIREEEFIKIEKIQGTLVLIGAADDVLWDTARYIRRMESRLQQKPHDCKLEATIYEHGSHFVFPQSMITRMMPGIANLFVKLSFRAVREYPAECLQTRRDIDSRLKNTITAWKEA